MRCRERIEFDAEAVIAVMADGISRKVMRRRNKKTGQWKYYGAEANGQG
jgi:hypothetical protein